MKITGITTEEYRWPRHKPISNGLHTYTHSGLGLVKIETDEGITGIGLGGGRPIGRATIEHLKPLLIGEDPIDVERLWHKMWVPKLIGRRGLTTRAISAIDIGLWDIRAKVAGMPLYKLLGGFRDRVPTYIAGGYYEEGKGLRELAAGDDRQRRDGRAGDQDEDRGGADPRGRGAGQGGPRGDRAGRQAAGRRQLRLPRLPGDPARAKRIEEYDVFWFEEPVAPDDYEGHRKAGRGDEHPDRDRRERVHPLRLPRPDRARRGADPQRRREGARRRDRVHEGGGAGAGARSRHRAARLAGHPRPPRRGDLQRADPGVLPRHRWTRCGARSTSTRCA